MTELTNIVDEMAHEEQQKQEAEKEAKENG